MRVDPKKLLADYKKFESNTFWVYFLAQIEKMRLDILNALGNGESLTLEKIKHKQGQSMAYKRIGLLADELVEMLKSKSG